MVLTQMINIMFTLFCLDLKETTLLEGKKSQCESLSHFFWRQI